MRFAAHTAILLTDALRRLRDAANLVPPPSLARRHRQLAGADRP